MQSSLAQWLEFAGFDPRKSSRWRRYGRCVRLIAYAFQHTFVHIFIEKIECDVVFVVGGRCIVHFVLADSHAFLALVLVFGEFAVAQQLHCFAVRQICAIIVQAAQRMLENELNIFQQVPHVILARAPVGKGVGYVEQTGVRTYQRVQQFALEDHFLQIALDENDHQQAALA